MSETLDCIIVGAGISGLMAATRLQGAGKNVVVIDKGRGVGGRMATRRFADSICDHGAQFMTVRSALFQSHVDRWVDGGLVAEWYRRKQTTLVKESGHPRYRGAKGMTTVPKALAADLSIRLQSPVKAVSCSGEAAQIELADESLLTAPAVIMTPPIPQTLALLDAGHVPLEAELKGTLASIVYDPCFAVMARLDGPSGLAAPGFVSGLDGAIAWMADNQTKGISDVPAVTLHASAAFSREHWSSDRREVGQTLCELAAPMLASTISDFQIHGWRYSQPVMTSPEPFAEVHGSPRILLAGDAFQGPRVEGAALSGLAAAQRVLGGIV